MPEDTYAQQRQQICAILWFVRSMNTERLYMVSELIATGKRTKRSQARGFLEVHLDFSRRERICRAHFA
jgi:hypothetical protein